MREELQAYERYFELTGNIPSKNSKDSQGKHKVKGSVAKGSGVVSSAGLECELSNVESIHPIIVVSSHGYDPIESLEDTSEPTANILSSKSMNSPSHLIELGSRAKTNSFSSV